MITVGLCDQSDGQRIKPGRYATATGKGSLCSSPRHRDEFCLYSVRKTGTIAAAGLRGQFPCVVALSSLVSMGAVYAVERRSITEHRQLNGNWTHRVAGAWLRMTVPHADWGDTNYTLQVPCMGIRFDVDKYIACPRRTADSQRTAIQFSINRNSDNLAFCRILRTDAALFREAH